MAIKPYDEMRKIDVSQYVEQRDGADYLNWAKCKELLHQNGAKVVYFEPCTNDNGSSLFMSDQVFTDKNGVTNRCYEVRVHIVIDDLEFEAQYPLMNGSNPVKDNSMTQQRVWNAQTRAFVKGVAMRTGLGFSLWLKNADEFETEDDLTKHKLSAIKERMEQEVTLLMKKGYSLSDVAKTLGLDEEVFKSKFSYFAELNKIEKRLLELLKNDSK